MKLGIGLYPTAFAVAFQDKKLMSKYLVLQSTNTQYGLVIYQAADCLPNPSSDCYGPYCSPQRLLNVLDKIE